MKNNFIRAAVFMLVLALMQSASFAEEGYKSWGEHKPMGGKGEKMSMDEKVIKKAHMIYAHKEEIGVTDEQLKQITDLKTDLKKDSIQKDAEIEVMDIDIEALVYQDEIDIDAINGLVDQKYDIKKAKYKKAVESYAALKKILSKEQSDKLKEMFLKQKETHEAKGSSKGSRMGSPMESPKGAPRAEME